MAARHTLAITATNTSNLVDLAKILLAAVEDATKEGVAPYQDPAIQLITFHIAFAGNGDVPFHGHWQKVYDYCLSRTSQYGVIGSSTEKEPPKYEPS